MGAAVTLLAAVILIALAAFALGYLFGDIGGERRAYRQFTAANRSPNRRRR